MSDFEFHRPGPKDESEPGYVYHATNVDGAHDIADAGHLNVHRPWHGTDQREWPDGGTEKRAYFNRRAHIVHSFAPEGHSAVLRVPTELHPFKDERGTGDTYTTKKIPTRHVEVRHSDGSWHPIAKLVAQKEESMMTRTPLLLEFKEKFAFRGGKLNVHTPREGAWLPKRLRHVHKDAPFSRGPRGKHPPRAGNPLRDEPLRHDLEKIARLRHRHSHIHSDASIDLDRTELLLDHDKHT